MSNPFSSPEPALLLVSTKNRDLWPLLWPMGTLWPGPTPEVHDSRSSRQSAHAQSQVWQIWLVLVSICCVHKVIQKQNDVGPGQSSRFLVLTKRSAASGDENVSNPTNKFVLLYSWVNLQPILQWSLNFVQCGIFLTTWRQVLENI